MNKALLLIMFISSYSLADVTYNKDIKPLFEVRCAACHGESNVFQNWMDYQTAYEKRKAIKDRVLIKKDMPLSNATQITEDERILIGKWVDEGAKK